MAELLPEVLPGKPKRKQKSLTSRKLRRALKLKAEGASIREIGKALDENPITINSAIESFKEVLAEYEKTADFRAARGDLVDAAQMKVLKNLLQDEKLAKASANNLGYVLDRLFNIGRLERGQSTKNVMSYTKIDIVEMSDEDK